MISKKESNMSLSKLPHNCGSPGCTRREITSTRHCSSPGCTGGQSSAPMTPVFKPFDPSTYKILEIQEFKKNNWTCIVARIEYPDAPEFGGIKIIVYRAPTLLDWINLKNKDPHFKSSDGAVYPIARFRGTSTGWYDAIEYARTTSGPK